MTIDKYRLHNGVLPKTLAEESALGMSIGFRYTIWQLQV